MTTTHDLVVIGGGSAGLSGAIAVARFGRDVMVVDAGQPRNAPAAGVHNLLGHDGIDPRELLRRGRAELAHYGGQVVEGRAVDARAVPGERLGFEVELADGQVLHGRRLLVTTGAVDPLPAIEGLAERWGRDLLHCPFCHGWEVRGRRIGVLATHPMTLHAAKLWSQLGEVTVIEHEDGWLSAEDRRVLDALGVTTVAGPARRVLVAEDRIVGVDLGDRTVELDALVAAPVADARNPILESLGVPVGPLEMAGHAMAWTAKADPQGGTEVPGVALAGNAVDPMAQVAQAMAGGTKAGAMMLMSLIEEETAEALAGSGQEVTA